LLQWIALERDKTGDVPRRTISIKADHLDISESTEERLSGVLVK